MSALPNLWHDENGWSKNHGFRPCPPDTICYYLYVCGQQSKAPDRAGNRIWELRGWDFDIAYYQIVGGAE